METDSDATLKITERSDRSAFMFLLQHMIKPFGSLLITPRKTHPVGSPRLTAPKKPRTLCDIHERKLGDIYVYDLQPKHLSKPEESREKPRRKRFYYFCGGGWRMPPSGEHWAFCTELARKLPDTAVSVVSYPLAPNSPAPTAFPQLMAAYKQLLQDAAQAGESVMLGGDSSGGNIILCLCLALIVEDESAPHPTALMAICPSVDMRKENPDIQKVAPHDPILRIPFINDNAKGWTGDWERSDPRVSPILADVSLLKKKGIACHGVTCSYDILGPDAVLFREKCRDAGVKGQWLAWEKQMHCFPLAWKYGLRESKEGKDWIVNVLRQS